MREVSKIYHKRPICGAHGQNFESVRLIDCYAPLLILAYGFIGSLLVLIGEIILDKKRKLTQPNLRRVDRSDLGLDLRGVELTAVR